MQVLKLIHNNKHHIAIITFLVAFFTYLLVYSFELTHFTLSIDEEFSNNIIHTIDLGRWGHALLKSTIYPEPFIPYYTEILSFILLSVSCVVIVKAFSLNLDESVFFAILYASSVQFAYQLQFLNQADTVATAILMASVAVYLIIHKKSILQSIILPALLLGYTASIYQSIIFFSLSMLIAYFLIDIIKGNDPGKHFKLLSKLFIAALIGVVLHFVIGKLVQHYFHITNESLFISDVKWITQSPKYAFKKICRSIEHFFLFKASYGLNTFLLAFLCLLLPLFSLKKNKIRYAIYALGSILALFSMNIILGNDLPTRILTSFSVFFTSAGLVGFITLNRNKYFWAVAVFSLLYGMSKVSFLFYLDYVAYNKDYRIASSIAEDMAKDLHISLEKPVKVYFFGPYDIKTENKSRYTYMFGSSFFNWDGGNSERISAFMNKTEIANIIPATYQDIKPGLQSIYAAPVWPNKGSIMRINDVVVVKLNQNVGYCPTGVKKGSYPKECN